MIKAVLLDLEDTLLQGVNCSVGESIQQSIESVSRSNPSTAEMASAYAAALNQLASHRDMMTCNAEVLSGSIAESLHVSHEETEDRLDLFFAFLNETIRKYVFADPCSVPLVSALLEQNLAVALAVQPIYPETSILEWLDWTGLSPYKDDLEFIACSRDLHFVKPDPAFYAEIVARIGVEPDETLLIGNCRSNVSAAAKAAGLHTWQICESAPLAAFFEHIHLDSWQEEYAPLSASCRNARTTISRQCRCAFWLGRRSKESSVVAKAGSRRMVDSSDSLPSRRCRSCRASTQVETDLD